MMNHFRSIFTVLAVLTAVQSTSLAQGLFITAAGPVNRSVGGAGTAAPLDAMGAMFWNPASITGLKQSELSVGLAGVLPNINTSSSISGLASGSTSADPGVTPLVNFGWVHRPEDSDLILGVGVFSAGGFRTNFPASLSNPVFLPQSNAAGTPGGLGQLFTQATFIQFVPTAALQVTDRISVGLSPTVTIGDISASPFVFDAPDDADGSGIPRYAPGVGSRSQWGGGFHAGIYYEGENGLNLGFTFKSPQWLESFSFNSTDELGRPRTVSAELDLPMVLSWGAAWTGWDQWVIATDIRYHDYSNTDGFRDSGFRSDFAVAGLGWESVVTVATGIQYEASEDLKLRIGYTYNENPIPDQQAFFNVGTALIYEHELHAGASVRINDHAWVHFAYTYYLENDVSGPIVTPAGAIPGSNVTNTLSAHIADVGLTIRY
ncbi:MAG: outer membrane protein transport protein [Fuerstiella sp.]